MHGFVENFDAVACATCSKGLVHPAKSGEDLAVEVNICWQCVAIKLGATLMDEKGYEMVE